jgi:hypothetical protein
MQRTRTRTLQEGGSWVIGGCCRGRFSSVGGSRKLWKFAIPEVRRSTNGLSHSLHGSMVAALIPVLSSKRNDPKYVLGVERLHRMTRSNSKAIWHTRSLLEPSMNCFTLPVALLEKYAMTTPTPQYIDVVAAVCRTLLFTTSHCLLM